jgi:hypothetical protein
MMGEIFALLCVVCGEKGVVDVMWWWWWLVGWLVGVGGPRKSSKEKGENSPPPGTTHAQFTPTEK